MRTLTVRHWPAITSQPVTIYPCRFVDVYPDFGILNSGSSLLKPQINHRGDCQQKIDTSEDSFFCRTDYPQGWVGLGADPFHTPVSESLPLAHMPQLLQPPGPSDEVFGVLRRFEIDRNSGNNQNFCGRSNEGQLPLHMGFSSRWADRLLGISFYLTWLIKIDWLFTLSINTYFKIINITLKFDFWYNWLIKIRWLYNLSIYY